MLSKSLLLGDKKDETTSAAAYKQPAVQKALVFTLISLLTLGDQLVKNAVLPPYIIHLTCTNMHATDCDSKTVVDKARGQLELATSLANVAAFLSVGVLSALADHPGIGRRRIYMVVMISIALNNACWTFVSTSSIQLLLGLQIATNVLGNNYTCLAIGFSMVADHSQREEKAKKRRKRESAQLLSHDLWLLLQQPLVRGSLLMLQQNSPL